jgi:NitT/TauT family transport system substrate-binding protein
VLQHDTSAIATLAARDDIQRPRDLAGKQYASYNGRFEMDVVRALVLRDGGDASQVKEVTPPPLDIWKGFVDGEVCLGGGGAAHDA